MSAPRITNEEQEIADVAKSRARGNRGEPGLQIARDGGATNRKGPFDGLGGASSFHISPPAARLQILGRTAVFVESGFLPKIAGLLRLGGTSLELKRRTPLGQ